ncbi:hypothetical protein QTP86_006970 [Hemibagrus guttatus]|nr:hypothetical protein QTP86_006970 [Hemibagrus guttatus]
MSVYSCYDMNLALFFSYPSEWVFFFFNFCPRIKRLFNSDYWNDGRSVSITSSGAAILETPLIDRIYVASMINTRQPSFSHFSCIRGNSIWRGKKRQEDVRAESVLREDGRMEIS